MIKRIMIVLVLFVQANILAQNLKFGKVSKAEVEETFYPEDSTATAAYLYKYRRSYFDWDISQGGFNLITEIHQRIKIYNKEGFKHANHFVSYYRPDAGKSESVSKIKGYTYNLENGKIVKAKLSKENIFREKVNKYTSKVKVAMPFIKEGSVVEFSYRITSPYATSIDDVEYQKSIPIKKLKSQIEFPEYYSFNKTSKGYYSVPMKTSYKNGNIGDINFNIEVYTFEKDNIPALKDNEPYVANIKNYRGGIKFELAHTNFTIIGGIFKNYSTNWKDICKQIYEQPSFGSELKKSTYFKTDLENLLVNAKTDSEKINAIFEFVKNKIKWDGFYGIHAEKGVKKAYKENTGNVADVNLILTAMLREAGLNANPVLVSSKGHGIPLFPTLKGFNYVITMVKFDNNSYLLLDATEKYSRPNILPIRALNWKGRVVTKEGASDWVELNLLKHAVEDNMIMVKISEDLLTEGIIRTKYNNLNALKYRKRKNHIKEEDLITRYEEANKVEVDNFKVMYQEEINKPIVRNVKFSSENLIEEINGKLYIEPLLFLTEHKNPFKLKERKFPVDFTTSWKDSHKVSIEIPKGYSIEKIPEPIAIGLPDNIGYFKYQVKAVGNKISANCILQFNTSLIAPDYYSYLKDFYGKLVAKESEKIILKKI